MQRLLERLQPVATRDVPLPADVDVLLLDHRGCDDLMPAALGLLDRDERAQLASLRHTDAVRCHALGRAAVRVLLGDRLDRDPRVLRFAAGPWGKPRLVGPEPWRFNVAHSGERILVAVAPQREVGVDLETTHPRRDLAVLAQRCLSPTELAVWQQQPPPVQQAWFHRFWTCKEAMLKAWGLGLGGGLQRFDVVLDQGPAHLGEVRLLAVPPGPWALHELVVPAGHAGAVAFGPVDHSPAVSRYTTPPPKSAT